MCSLTIDPDVAESVGHNLLCSSTLSARRNEFISKVKTGYGIIVGFASRHGWLEHLHPPLFSTVEVFETQKDLWNKIRQLTSSPNTPMPTDGLSAAICFGHLVAITPEIYRELRTEYANIDKGWTRLLAHEIAHELHIRIVGDENKMGPKWFYEGFAMYAAGQNFGEQSYSSIEQIKTAMQAEERGSYAKYTKVFEFFLERIDINLMLQKAAASDFETWILERAMSISSEAKGNTKR